MMQPPQPPPPPPPVTVTINKLAYFHKLYGGDNSLNINKHRRKHKSTDHDESASIASETTTSSTGTNENQNDNAEDDIDEDDISDTSLPPALEDRLQNYARKQVERESQNNNDNNNSRNEEVPSYISIPTVQQIVEAMPTSASCVAHVLDRRIHLDQFQNPPENVTLYQLLRAWVQDDPYRYPPSTTTLDPPILPSSSPPTTTGNHQHPSSKTTTTQTLVSSSTKDTQPSSSSDRMDLISQLLQHNHQDHAHETTKKRYAMEDLQPDWARRRQSRQKTRRMDSMIRDEDRRIWKDLQRRGLVTSARDL
jgi:hypothetical protein